MLAGFYLFIPFWKIKVIEKLVETSWNHSPLKQSQFVALQKNPLSPIITAVASRLLIANKFMISFFKKVGMKKLNTRVYMESFGSFRNAMQCTLINWLKNLSFTIIYGNSYLIFTQEKNGERICSFPSYSYIILNQVQTTCFVAHTSYFLICLMLILLIYQIRVKSVFLVGVQRLQRY